MESYPTSNPMTGIKALGYTWEKNVEGNLQNSNSISPRENAHISARECLRRRRLCLLSELQKNGLTFIFTGL